jgi:hypothetical protein
MKRFLALSLAALAAPAFAEAPSTSYIFPAGGQRGTKVDVRVGGHYLHDRAAWQVLGGGVKASEHLTLTSRIWFEGPLIKQPASQQSENYPQDYLGTIEIAPDAATGPRPWRAMNAQGVTAPLKFVVGSLPEVVEQEIEGRPLPVEVKLPVTINGRIFPREDVDAWTFDAAAGQAITMSVCAAEIGSPLEAELEVRDASGKLIAESLPGLRPDPQLRFVAPSAGKYEVRITDSRFAGLQHYVYRLTISGDAWVDHVFPLGGRRGTSVALSLAGQAVPSEAVNVALHDVPPGIIRQAIAIGGKMTNDVLLDIDELPEVIEPANGALPELMVPIVTNGRIETPGDVDAWTFTATKGVPLAIELRAARLGSPLDSLIVVKDAAGKELAKHDDIRGGSPDAELTFTPPADGKYTVEVSDEYASRGGPAFGYRLKIAPAKPDFELTLASDSVAVDVGGEKKLAVQVERSGGFNAPIKLKVAGLPAQASAAEVTVPANQNKAEIAVKVDKASPVQFAPLTITGSADFNGTTIEHRATTAAPPGEAPIDQVLLACTLPTPFKHKGEYEFRYIARGGTLKKHYTLDRNGFTGPIEVKLADRQGRHLQGVTGPTIVVPPEASEFDYTVTLPPWMELGRTSRTNLMLTGEVTDAAGVKHKVSYSTVEQNEQLIALVSPAPLRLGVSTSAIPFAPNSELIVNVQVFRDKALDADVKLELVLPPHVRDVSADSIAVPRDKSSAELRFKLGPSPGPFTQPLIIRGIAEHRSGPISAETSVELIERPK